MTARSGQEPPPHTVPTFRIVSRSALIVAGGAGASATVNPTLGTAFATGEPSQTTVEPPSHTRANAVRCPAEDARTASCT